MAQRTLFVFATLVGALLAAALFITSSRAGLQLASALLISIAAFLVAMLPSVLMLRASSDAIQHLVHQTRGDEARSPALADGRLGILARAIHDLRQQFADEKLRFDHYRMAVEQIVASLGEGLIAVNQRGQIIFVNQRVGEIFGSRLAEVGRSFFEAVPQKSVIAAFDQALKGNASSDRISVTVQGVERQIEARFFPVTGAADLAAVALFIDITQLERLQRIRKNFLDDFSHEVRTPLAGLRSAAETFEHRNLTDQQQDQLRSVMLRQLSRIERLVNDLSELNRIESGELKLEVRRVDLGALLRELRDDFQQRSKAPLKLELPSEAIILTADRERLQQVFANLLDNAIKYGCGRDITIGAAKEGSEVVACVSDRGEGIPPEQVERIFHRFHRVDQSRSQQVPGSGLGLAIAKHLVLMHAGTIRAFNRARGGATFEVRLPGVTAEASGD